MLSSERRPSYPTNLMQQRTRPLLGIIKTTPGAKKMALVTTTHKIYLAAVKYETAALAPGRSARKPLRAASKSWCME